LSLPKLTIPKLALPGLAARPAAPSTTEDAVVEAHAAEEAEADKANADEADPDKADPDKADPDKANADEPGVIEDSIAEPVEAPTEAGEPTDEPATDERAAEEPIEEHAAAEPAEPDSSVAASSPAPASTALSVRGLTKSFDGKLAVDGIDLDVHVGAFYGIVGPNGAGKTTTLSMITGLLRPTAGTITVNGADVWSDPVAAKRAMGVLPDRLRLFDRLTGSQVLYYAGVLRGLDAETVRKRTADLAQAFGLEESLGRLVTDYSAGMTKKIALAAAMIHTPRLLVLDEPFESVDPVSAATVTEILKNYVANGGTVVLSSHSMDLVQRICDHVAVIVNGVILADGTMAEVRNGLTLEERFVELAGGRKSVEGLEWLHTFSD
jgi:ABC-2 type transport system ATP-binding protein